MGGVRNGKSAGTPEPAAARQDALRAGAPDVGPAEETRDAVDRHLRSALGLLREGSAPRAFGELARASRTAPMTPRLAAALVRFALLAGTEAAAITLLEAATGPTPAVRLAARRQLARVLRRVGQLPRAIASLEAILTEYPEDRRARWGLEVLRARLEGEPASSGVLSKLPARKAGVQVPAIWEEDSGCRSKTELELPAVDLSSGASRTELRTKTEVELPALNLGGPGAESRTKTEVELPAFGLSPGAPRRSKPLGEGAPRSEPPSPVRAERTEAPPATQAAAGPVKDRPAAEASPWETQEVSMADLEAALGAAHSPGAAVPAAGAGPARPGAASRAEDAEELARSQKLEAQLIARQAWRELAQLYLKRADRAKDAAVRAEALTRLAEVMETELQDPAGAARMYREIVDLTGDRAALREQVRLLSSRGDASLVRRALDEAIQRARSDRARAGALLTRGERWLHMGEPLKAREDFEAADALAPGLLPVLAGLLRCVTDAERPAAAERLRLALAAAPRRAPDRLEALRLLAQAAEESLVDLRMAQWAWTEVLAESPDSELARERLVALARRLGDPKALGHLLRAQLARESRGPSARQARLELVSTLEALGDAEAALHELRQAVRYEPGHKEAWLLLVDRLIARGNMGEAAWALEHAATATEDELERERTWERLARLWTDVLRNPERAQVFARRAEGLRLAREEREMPPPEPPRSATPRREPSGPRSPLVPAPPTVSLTPSGIAALANEVTSTTDPDAPPAAVGEPVSGNEGARARGGGASSPGARDRAAPGGASAVSGPPGERAERTSAAPTGKAVQSSEAPPEEPAPASPARRGKRASKAGGASAPPAKAGPESSRAPASAAGDAAPAGEGPGRPAGPARASGGTNVPSTAEGAGDGASRAERAPASGGTNVPSTPVGAGAGSRRAERAPASGGTNVPSTPVGAGTGSRRADRAPAAGGTNVPSTLVGAGAGSRRADRASVAAPPAGSPAAPSGRAEPRASASGGAAPASKSPAPPRGAAPRGEKHSAPPAVSDGEPSVAATRALGASTRVHGQQGRSAAGDTDSPSRGAQATDLMAGEALDLGSAPVPETRVISWEAPPGRMDPVRRIVRSRPEGTVSLPAPGRPAAAKPPPPPETREPPARVGPGAAETREAPVVVEPSPDTEPNAFRHLRERPLDAKPYRELAGYFDERGDAARATLMREIADALEGRETPTPRHQRPPLTSDERAGLRHPGLRTPSGELLACTGIALCRLFPAQGRAAGTSEPLRASAGPGAPAVLDALHTSARLLGVHLPELVLAEDDGPPFTAVHTGSPRLLVGRLALRQPLPAAELRFHAGRALLSLSPDLLALRALKGGQLLRALALLTTILKDPRASGPEARVVRESLSPRALERAVALVEPGTRDFNASALADAARDSANRAGLVACGSVGPALAVLRARHNPDAELVELLRFAASERYLELRAPR
ncbi:hypothetical protein [Myxococcus sp. RHSTA-1-4]|uniref:hypothetical protein n=1 Tax=Myxococcus sp. RHSTA-1-4 TaxID=2874601 RepID=UPI001CBF0C36|nr:hypothetical protein [Myxococcus sp. RHSTA-1-4]MBZ4414860.1 hypothetical protein [Myxococcus sp. RHSTA-1-4]